MSPPVSADDVRRAAALIADAVPPTPCLRAFRLGEQLGRECWIKAESLQITGSFKPRGALNWIRNAADSELRRGLITISAGNHARALAWAARRAGAAVTVCMPAAANPAKVAATRELGAEVVLHGTINETMAKMEELRRERDLVLVHPFDDLRIIAGQGTVGLEIAAQMPRPGTVLVPVGGGGLVSGIATALKDSDRAWRVIGVEPAGAACLRRAWDAGGPVRLEQVDTVAAALAASLAGKHTYACSRAVVDDVVTVDDGAILDAMRALAFDAGLVAEEGASVALAALRCGAVDVPEGSPVCVVVTGANVDPQRWPHAVGN